MKKNLLNRFFAIIWAAVIAMSIFFAGVQTALGMASSGVEGNRSKGEMLLPPLPQVLMFTSGNTLSVDGFLTAAVTTTANDGGGTISYSIVNGTGSAVIDPVTGVITGVQAGTVLLTANSSGNANYNPASISQLIVITQTTPLLWITSANSIPLQGNLTASVNTTATFGRGGAITFAIANGSGLATVNPVTGYMTGLQAGTVTLIATSAGDADYTPATASQLITVTQNVPVLSITSPNTMIVDGTLTATAVSSAPMGQGGVITFSVSSGSGSATVNATTGLIKAVSAGTIALIATSAGDSSYSSASTAQLITIGKASQILTVTSPSALSVNASLTVTVNTTATNGRGGAYSFAVTSGSGSATVSATGVVKGISSGTVILTVSSAGDSDYNGANVSQLITVGKSTPTLSITSPNTMVVDGSMIASISSTAAGWNMITYSITNGTGLAFVNPTTGLIVAVRAGTVTLTANSAANTNYYASTASQLITIAKNTPTLTITSPNVIQVYGSLTASVSTTATYSRGGAITFTFSVMAGSGSATVNPVTGFIKTLQAGTVTLIATSEGDGDYNSATTSQLITITKKTPTIAITSANTLAVGNSLTVTVSSSAMGGGAVTFSLVAGSGSATINPVSGYFTALKAGTVTLIAHAAGDTNYQAASVSQVITIIKVNTAPVITSFSPGSGAMGTVVTISGTGFSPLAANNFVLFGDTQATVISVSGTTTLTVMVPNVNMYYPQRWISVTNLSNGLTGYSANSFTVTYPVAPVITSFSPGSGPAGTVITLKGTGFNAVANYNVVYFGDTQAVVLSVVGTTTLTVVVPNVNMSYPYRWISVTNWGTGLSAYSPSAFVVTYPSAPIITSFSPGSGPVGTLVTINGSGFNPVAANNWVYFGNTQATIVSVSGTTSMLVTVPYIVNYPYRLISVTNLATGLTAYSANSFMVTAALGDTQPILELSGSDATEEQQIKIPSAFSPNADGVNDVFKIENISNYPNNHIVIVNRDGEEVFRAQGYNNESITFSGKSNTGLELADGTYYFTITYYNNGQTQIRKGYFKMKK